MSWVIILQGIIILGLGLFSFLYLQNEGCLQDGTAPVILVTYIYFQTLTSVLIFAGVISIFVLKDFLEKEEIEFRINRMQQKQSEETIQNLRIQRHDFHNQLSIIKAWAELGDTKNILEYLRDEQAAVQETKAFLHIQSPVLYILFTTIQGKAMEENIKLVVDSLITLEDFDYSWSKTNRIFSNLLHNAIEAVDAQKTKDAPDREIHVYIWDTEEKFIFQVWTPTVIPENDPERVFAPGVTSKGEAGRGYGLFIVRKLLRELGGEIKVKSGPEIGTEFCLEFPKKTRGFSPRINLPVSSYFHYG
ncbi:MAG: GHKL domain-containing protein [Firmicutes bacterium]|nr:GHKL domain-containing protein [Bacillota bacterium]